MTPASLRADLERLHRDLSALVNRVHREPWSMHLPGSDLGDALDALARTRDELAAALGGDAR